ncbi:hypothetical protein BXO18_10275 [Salmonella enterica subsp. enterica serovar Amager]|nr:hypothetical protein [Salmonella enterica subsp. enterica serovar Amager]ECF3419640.1 hypothetical protein [Salmonella enterica subsp. enterica serovar Amager]EDD8809157.1 hypothetical protein [Salmonella enterica subsp. enterica serovar Amager]
MLKTIEYLIVICINYHKIVFDRFKRYDERQKELNPINWLGGGFERFYQSGVGTESFSFLYRTLLRGMAWTDIQRFVGALLLAVLRGCFLSLTEGSISCVKFYWLLVSLFC